VVCTVGFMPIQTDIGQYNETKQEGFFVKQNDKLLKISLNGHTVIARQGAMVAYQGDVHFEHKGSGSMAKFLKKAVTGEGAPIMTASGSGELFLADQAYSVHIMYLENDSISVSGRNLLAMDANIQWDIRRVSKGGGLSSLAAGASAGGFFNVLLQGTGYVAVTTDGPPIVLNVAEAPTFADPSAAVCWSSGVSMTVKADVQMKSFIGMGSGESFQIAFGGQGWVMVQPSEGRLITPYA